MKGEFNYTLKKLIEFSLADGKVPVIDFRPLAEIVNVETRKVSAPDIISVNKVAEPVEDYKIAGK